MDKAAHSQLSKAATGIDGLDAITEGGLPAGRPTLLCGAAGCGKTLFGVTFLVEGTLRFNEPGVLMTFEERPQDISDNVKSLGYDLSGLVASKKLIIDHVKIERGDHEQSGEYDLEGLFVRLGHAIDKIGAKRVVLDTIENLFAGLSDTTILRSELRRLFTWLKEKNVTAIITGERGEGQLSRHGLEEYVSDCVILLDNRVQNQITTRLLRVVKYRGSNSWNQRISLPDRPQRHQRSSHYVRWSSSSNIQRACPNRYPRAGQHARCRGLLQRLEHTDFGRFGIGKDNFRITLCKRDLPTR